MTDDGHTYQKKAIKAWLNKQKTSPLTGAKLNTKVLRPNFLVKEILSAFFEKTAPLATQMYELKYLGSKIMTNFRKNKLKLKY